MPHFFFHFVREFVSKCARFAYLFKCNLTGDVSSVAFLFYAIKFPPFCFSQFMENKFPTFYNCSSRLYDPLEAIFYSVVCVDDKQKQQHSYKNCNVSFDYTAIVNAS